jgi:hypothetical protein
VPAGDDVEEAVNTAAAIERILSEGRTSSTYKFAVLRALVDAVIDAPRQEPRNGFHLIPVIELAGRLLAYYWKPFVLGVKQAGAGFEVGTALAELRTACPVVEHANIAWNEPSAGAAAADAALRAPHLPADLRRALLDLRETLLEFPLKHLPNIGRERLEILQVLTLTEGSTSPLLMSYDQNLAAAAKKKAFKESVSWAEMLEVERTFVVLSARTWEEIADLRFWLRDAIKLRWLTACQGYAADMPVPLDCLEIDAPGRDQVAMYELRAAYAALGWRHCIYTGKELKGNIEMDHVLPFSRFPVNLFWNVVPTTPQVNQDKGARLPHLDSEVGERYRAFLARCVDASPEPVRRDLAATWRQYFQTSGLQAATQPGAVARLWSMIDSTRRNLAELGVDSWRVQS